MYIVDTDRLCGSCIKMLIWANLAITWRQHDDNKLGEKWIKNDKHIKNSVPETLTESPSQGPTGAVHPFNVIQNVTEGKPRVYSQQLLIVYSSSVLVTFLTEIAFIFIFTFGFYIFTYDVHKLSFSVTIMKDLSTSAITTTTYTIQYSYTMHMQLMIA